MPALVAEGGPPTWKQSPPYEISLNQEEVDCSRLVHGTKVTEIV